MKIKLKYNELGIKCIVGLIMLGIIGVVCGINYPEYEQLKLYRKLVSDVFKEQGTEIESITFSNVNKMGTIKTCRSAIKVESSFNELSIGEQEKIMHSYDQLIDIYERENPYHLKNSYILIFSGDIVCDSDIYHYYDSSNEISMYKNGEELVSDRKSQSYDEGTSVELEARQLLKNRIESQLNKKCKSITI